MIRFIKAQKKDKALIKRWWAVPHVRDFWDNSPQMWQNAEDYLDDGIVDLYDYWLGYIDQAPFALLLSSWIDPAEQSIYNNYCIADGDNWTIDFMIGDPHYLGKGLATPALKAFMTAAPKSVKRFIIDPAHDNVRAVHAYRSAGFKEVTRFKPASGFFADKEHLLMVHERNES